MNTQRRFLVGAFFQGLIIFLGLWAIFLGKTGIGSGMIAATIAVFVVRMIKSRKIIEMEKRGIDPYDERTWFVAGKAAYAGYSSSVVLMAVVVIIGSIFGPEVSVNPYNMLGLVVAAQVLLYAGFYYYFNNRE